MIHTCILTAHLCITITVITLFTEEYTLTTVFQTLLNTPEDGRIPPKHGG